MCLSFTTLTIGTMEISDTESIGGLCGGAIGDATRTIGGPPPFVTIKLSIISDHSRGSLRFGKYDTQYDGGRQKQRRTQCASRHPTHLF